jgi:hypothetical protein
MTEKTKQQTIEKKKAQETKQETVRQSEREVRQS